ncbi:MAG: amidohydrolase [Solirubrobacterales bacterium]|jgi:5-methylthioadenosine/S-adenosylhomocysteine deaminase|nr:amidohydrolase [Solirubrobacterales bacterium]
MSADLPASPVLVEGGTVVTMDAARSRYDDGYVLVRDGEIAAVGPRSELTADEVAGAIRIDAAGCVIVPGLINTHQHHWYNLFKGLGGGMRLEQWIQNLLRPTAEAITPVEIEIASRLACLEMLLTGTTTCLNHSVTASDHETVAATLSPVLHSGTRQLFAKEVRPHDLEHQLALAEEVHRRWHGAGEGRITVGLVLESTAHWVAMGTSSEELIARGNELAIRLGCRISDHVAGGTMSRESGYLRFVLEMGRTDIEFLQQLGVLDRRWVLAHAIHARDRDIELIATAGASVAHTPTSESSRGGGITPVKRFRDAGILVSLGSDGPMVDTSVDMVEQMKAVILFQNQLHRDPLALTPEDALAMATSDAAEALGLADSLGSLEPGKRADIAVFDLENPACAVWHDPVVALVHSHGRLRSLLVEGEELVRDGALTRTTADEVGEILAEARRRADELLQRADVPAAARRAEGRAALDAIV